MGGNARVGMEDTVWRYPHKDEKIESSAEEVRDAIAIARLLGREVMTPNEYRQAIGLKPRFDFLPEGMIWGKEIGKEKVIENSIITFLLVIILLGLLFLYIMCPFFAKKLVKTEDSTTLVRLYLFSIASETLVEVFFTFLRIRFQNLKMVILTLVDFILSTTLIIFFILAVLNIRY
jgi:hypothetical protein